VPPEISMRWVSKFMNKFCKLGYIEYNRKLEIHNSLLNVVLYDKREIGMKDASDERAPLCAPFPGCHYCCVGLK
jgi:hypothetical protein